MKRIAIIEDHPIIAAGLNNLVAEIWNSSVIESFDDIARFDQYQSYNKPFDLIIADIHLEGANTLEWLLLQKIQHPKIPIIVYSSSHPWELSLTKKNFPFDGYIQKNAEIELLRESLISIANGKIFLPDNLIWEKPKFLNQQILILTKRETEILMLIKVGKTNKEMAELLFLSEFTIKSHRQKMMRKFGARNIAELISKTTPQE